MKKFLKRIVSIALAALMITVTLCSLIVPVSAETVLSNDADTASNTVDGRVMVGIDISGWQEYVNWTNVKNSGVEFAMVRLCSRSSSPHGYTKDPMLDSHINGAKSQGIHLGAYFFSYANSVNAVVDEANMVVNILKDYPATFDFPIVFDAEKDNNVTDDHHITSFAADACVTFKNILEANGYYVMIYANSNWFNNVIVPSNKIANCDLWQAFYPLITTEKEKYEGYTPEQAKSIDFSTRRELNNNNENVFMWQITQKGTVSGIATNGVDIDICIRDYSQIIPARGFNDFCPNIPLTGHNWQVGNDQDTHYQICSECQSKKNVSEHSYTLHYDNEMQHDMVCSCQYIKENIAHTFEYVIDGDIHKKVCVCGAVDESSVGSHNFEYVIEGEIHKKICVCGAVDESSVGSHTFVKNHDEDKHYEFCGICQQIKDGSTQAHSFDDNGTCSCGYIDKNFSPPEEDTVEIHYTETVRLATDEKELGGCESSIGATTLISAALVLGCGMAFRKKEE